ncbi:YidC/Oxa1 family membrane protein insertase [Natranaerobius thermophilus]|uniref:60 kDa inner membrane insertion protein n=1 Tax=Natranaerobius thermophilus (strain ATCC BAA-1301 / DSM 18059 / JW/NM-WN-LF) TaxID=457570 RepID=B2A472_NATTJ|nr:YidC/Oxa1 family membrane protein insertase [Natranaerobius thermophilus]ACB86478.1 60 kDa inner membrane insertion protein [Natranaerobius thermophilus JW/NM-WN-LF]
MLDPIISVLGSILSFFYELTGSYGLAIVILTIGVRALTFPLMAKQMQSTNKMQELQPELKKLQEKYKDDKETLNKKTMELWKKHKVNPAAGCLPLIVQMPVLIAMFRLLRDYQQFLGDVDPVFLGIDLSQSDPFFILPILAGGTTFLQQKLTMTSQSNSSMMMIMPFMIIFISSTLPAGLPLYFVVGNIFSLIAHLVMKKNKPETQKEGGANQ